MSHILNNFLTQLSEKGLLKKTPQQITEILDLDEIWEKLIAPTWDLGDIPAGISSKRANQILTLAKENVNKEIIHTKNCKYFKPTKQHENFYTKGFFSGPAKEEEIIDWLYSIYRKQIKTKVVKKDQVAEPNVLNKKEKVDEKTKVEKDEKIQRNAMLAKGAKNARQVWEDDDSEKAKGNDFDGIVHANVEKIVKKFKLTKMEKDLFTNYVEYMNDESKMPFLVVVLTSDREYLDKFLDTDLNNLGDEIFEEKIDYSGNRKANIDMYNLTDDDQVDNRLLLYKGVLRKISKFDKAKRDNIYKNYFKVKIDRTNMAKSRQQVYEGFVDYIAELSQKDLEKFIDDVFDKNATIF